MFLNGAQIHRTASVRLPAGRSEVRFVGLDPYLNPESIQLNAGGLTVLSVTRHDNFLEPIEETAEVLRLRERIGEKSDSVAAEQVMLEVYEREELMLVANQDLGGTDGGATAGQIESVADFLRNRLREIRTARLSHEKQIKRLKAGIESLQRQLEALMGSMKPAPSSEIAVVVERSSAGTSEFELSYVSRRANWTPMYDFRVEDVDHPLSLHYKASIQQHTSEVWENAKLTLSTADPSQRRVKPQPRPQYVRYYTPAPVGRAFSKAQMSQRKAGEYDEVVVIADMGEEESAPMEYVTVETRSNTTSTEFEIDSPYTIESDADASIIDIVQHDVEGVFEYYAAPALSRDAFLTARVTGWESYNLLSGSANLFFGNTFVGQTYLDMQNVSDTLDLSLGIDQGIIVKRTQQEDFTKKRFLGGRRTDVSAYEIEIRNNKAVPIRIVIEDQIPLSSDGSIEVSLEDDGGAHHIRETGVLRWEKEIPPATTETMQFQYEVRYPRDRQVVVN